MTTDPVKYVEWEQLETYYKLFTEFEEYFSVIRNMCFMMRLYGGDNGYTFSSHFPCHLPFVGFILKIQQISF